MRVGDLCARSMRVAFPEEALATAARRMLEHGVGALVVLNPAHPQGRPIGILTDRDIVRGQLRRAADLSCLAVGDVMTHRPLVLGEDLDPAEAVQALKMRTVRRAPVVDRAGTLIGMVSLDDLLPALARQLEDLAALMSSQARQARTGVRDEHLRSG